MNDPTCMPLTLTLSDKFGDYGLISVIVLKMDGDAVVIDEYLMSCRVLQRGVEQFAMNNIVDFAARKGAKRVVGSYIRTEKNDMVKDFFAGFGFEKTREHPNGDSDWVLAVDAYEPREVFMTPLMIEP